MVYHKASLVAQRDFWRLLTREKIPLDRLGHSFSRMDEMEHKAAATYKIVLDRYPSNAKLLRSYAKFLESIKVQKMQAQCDRSTCLNVQHTEALFPCQAYICQLSRNHLQTLNDHSAICPGAKSLECVAVLCRMTLGEQRATMLRQRSRKSWKRTKQLTFRYSTGGIRPMAGCLLACHMPVVS